MTKANESKKRPYEAPSLVAYSREEILGMMGPARANYGGPGGAP